MVSEKVSTVTAPLVGRRPRETGINCSLLIGSRHGRVKARLVALFLFVVGISFVLSAYRSLGREFRGMIVEKHEDHTLSHFYWVGLTPLPAAELGSGSSEIMQILKQESPSRRVGVSRIVFQNAQLFEVISKSDFSPFIFLGSDRYLDLGLQWFLWGLVCLFAAYFAHRQAETRPQRPPAEEVPPYEANFH